MTGATVSNYERAETQIAADDLPRVAEVLGVSPCAFFESMPPVTDVPRETVPQTNPEERSWWAIGENFGNKQFVLARTREEAIRILNEPSVFGGSPPAGQRNISIDEVFPVASTDVPSIFLVENPPEAETGSPLEADREPTAASGPDAGRSAVIAQRTDAALARADELERAQAGVPMDPAVERAFVSYLRERLRLEAQDAELVALFVARLIKDGGGEKKGAGN